MWLFTKHGFYSAVRARQGGGSQHQPVNPDKIMVRARVRSYVTALKQRFDDLVSQWGRKDECRILYSRALIRHEYDGSHMRSVLSPAVCRKAIKVGGKRRDGINRATRWLTFRPLRPKRLKTGKDRK